MNITHIFDAGSSQLTDYVEKNSVGNKIASPDGVIWTVTGLEVDDNIPPNPSTGKSSVKVTLTID